VLRADVNQNAANETVEIIRQENGTSRACGTLTTFRRKKQVFGQGVWPGWHKTKKARRVMPAGR
jgi:hypothetical protein